MKCWVEYQGYQYLTLRNADQFGVMEGPAFNAFLEAARSPSSCTVSVNGSPQTICGAILIWGDVDDSGRNDVKRAHKIVDVLSMKNIIDDLVFKEDQQYRKFLEERLWWCQHLFQRLEKC